MATLPQKTHVSSLTGFPQRTVRAGDLPIPLPNPYFHQGDNILIIIPHLHLAEACWFDNSISFIPGKGECFFRFVLNAVSQIYILK